MTDTVMRRTATIVLVVCGVAGGQEAGPLGKVGDAAPVELGNRYIDPAHGFSLRPPTGTVRQRGFSTARLVSWARQDEKTRAILWTFSVLQVSPKSKDVKLEDYRRVLIAELARTDQYKVSSSRIAPVAGKGAIDLQGVSGGPMRLWKRQVWVLAEPGRFLVFLMAGPVDRRERLDRICSNVLSTLKLTDPKLAREQTRKNLERGKDVLAAFNDRKVSAILHKQPRWFLLSLEDKPVGFMHASEAWKIVDGVPGPLVTTCLVLRVPGDQLRVLRRSMFATARGDFERWRQQRTVGSGRTAAVATESGIKKEDLVLCNVAVAGKGQSKKKKVPPAIYLPKALGWLMLRLIDLKTPTSCSFATYASRENNFDMRTFTVVGPERIQWAGQSIRAVRATDQATANTEATTMWLDGTGSLLRMKSPEGLVMEAAAEAAVRRRFPEDAKLAAQPFGPQPPRRRRPRR